MRRTIRRFDSVITKRVHSLSVSFKPIMSLLTFVGEPPFTVGIAAGMVGFGIAGGGNNVLTYAGAVAIATVIVTTILKEFMRRPRPDNDYTRNMIIRTFSFPSGHASGSTVCFGAFIYALAHYYPGIAIPGMLAVAILSFGIGTSRVYLNAHYPTDVIAGWIIGIIGLFALASIEATCHFSCF